MADGDAFFRVEGEGEIHVHFNPASVQLTIANKLKKEGQGQKVEESSAKLSFDLIFDTTRNATAGSRPANVRDATAAVARLTGEKGKAPPRVTFQWGDFAFTGIVDTYKEVIDFFSAEGIPLRATISIGMTQEDLTFPRDGGSAAAGTYSGATVTDGGGNAAGAGPDDAVETNSPPGASATDLATQGGDPAAGRAIAAMNGEESMRFSASASLTITAGVQLSGPVAFASGGMGFGFGASAGFGVSAGVGIGAGVSGGVSAGLSGSAGVSSAFSAGLSGSAGVSSAFSAGLSGSAGVSTAISAGLSGGATTQVGFSTGMQVGTSMNSAAGVNYTAGYSVSTSSSISTGYASGPAFGGRASASVTASEGAFAGLRTPPNASRRARLDTRKLVPHNDAHAYSVREDSAFEIGGRVVGAPRGRARRRIRFGEE